MNHYQKLPTPRSIRVLNLKQPVSSIDKPFEDWEVPADSFESPVDDPRTQAVHCELSVISLDGPESFDALSYVWGDPSVNRQYMFCNG